MGAAGLLSVIVASVLDEVVSWILRVNGDCGGPVSFPFCFVVCVVFFMGGSMGVMRGGR